MKPEITAILLAAGLMLCMLFLQEVGRRVGAWQRKRDPEGAGAGIGAVDGAVFALLGLIIAFTFSGAADRFERRRQLVVEEANAIGTAYLRLDLLRPEARDALRGKFREYVDLRIDTYRNLSDVAAAYVALGRSTAFQGEIWTEAVAAARGDSSASMLLLPALNEMIDITTTRTVAARTHIPSLIFAMLMALALVSSLLAGYGMSGSRRRSPLHGVGFAAVVAVTFLVILDLEFPRIGLIRLDPFDQVLVEVRNSMK